MVIYMALIDKITVGEEEGMLRWIRWYASPSTLVDKTKLLQYWQPAKENLVQIFGGELILSKEVKFQMGIEELENLIDEQVLNYHSKAMDFVRAFNEKLISCGAPFEYYNCLSQLLWTHTLASNTYEGDNYALPLPNGKTLMINHGCKVSKILGKIATEFNISGYEDFRICHSQALNQKMLKGKLCLSIHPLDYMTMSDNDCGWESCMSWAEEGEYRRGTVEMMNSPMVVVAYLAADDPYAIGSLNWSNKKWRELFIINSDIITGVKPYPYHNEHLEKMVCDWLKELAMQNMGWMYFDKLITYSHRREFRFNGDEFVIGFETDTMYNDFGTREHIGYIGINAPKAIWHNYSGESQCMHCGEVGEFEGEQDLVCYSCDDSARCYECGDRYSRENMYQLDGDWYCEYCYDNIAQECTICEENHHTNNCYDLYLGRVHPDDPTKAQIFNGSRINVCDHCFDMLKDHAAEWVNKYLKPSAEMHDFTDYWTHYYWFNVTDLTSEGLQLFGYENIQDFEDDNYDVIDIASPY